jgi:hypothetical protein
MTKHRLLILAALIAAAGLLGRAQVTEADHPGNGPNHGVRQIELAYAGDPLAYGVTDSAQGNLKIQVAAAEGGRYELHVNHLQCNGVAFDDTQRAIEAHQYYAVYVNDEAMFNFNTSCQYGPAGVEGNFSTMVVNDGNTAFDLLEDDLTVEVRLEPVGGVALEGFDAAE